RGCAGGGGGGARGGAGDPEARRRDGHLLRGDEERGRRHPDGADGAGSGIPPGGVDPSRRPLMRLLQPLCWALLIALALRFLLRSVPVSGPRRRGAPDVLVKDPVCQPYFLPWRALPGTGDACRALS